MKKVLRSILIVLALALLNVTVNAATSSHEPYGHSYGDAVNGRTVYRFYEFKNGVYNITKEYYSKGNKLYKIHDIIPIADTYGSSAEYNGFDSKGNFYIITPTQQLLQIGVGKKLLLEAGAIRLDYNSDDLVRGVYTSSGRVLLPNLKPVQQVEDENNTPAPQPKPANRVQAYTNSANEMVYEAFKNGKLKLTLIVSKDGKKVLNATMGIRLSDSMDGPKFVGLDTNYNVYLAEGNALYRFKFGSWHSAERIALAGNYKSFLNSSDGFISKIRTSSDSYTIQQLTTSRKWKAKKDYCVRKDTYVTMYLKGKVASHTLRKQGKNLLLDGKKIATNVTQYGFTKSHKIVYIRNSICYQAKLSKPTKGKKLYASSKNFSFNSNKFVVKVKLKKGAKKIK